jgi:putative oxidoreductase
MKTLLRSVLGSRVTGRASLIATGLRLVSGAVFALAALAKLVDLETAAQGLERFGYPRTPVLPLVLGLLELVGALALLLGVITRPAALGLAIVMIGATAANLRFLPAMAPLTIGLFVCMVYLVWAGSGPLAIDNRLYHSLTHTTA